MVVKPRPQVLVGHGHKVVVGLAPPSPVVAPTVLFVTPPCFLGVAICTRYC